ncbi:hypothetical protein [Sphingosinicella sp. BN140058]|uniref:OB-fold protein n=1 Tax=Sphingosinicella sp. BN140058 TaxID=1892855 RepID=UPI0013ED873B|nr:hypothetical protein [Sphingosinicella sp. BN140058]
MKCRECAAEVSPLREFCPHCGTPIGGGLSDRGGADERSEEDLKRTRRKVVIAGAAILLTIGIAGKLSWFGAAIDHESHERPKGAATVQAGQLFEAYRDDPRAADKLYRHREIVVTGEFVRIAPDGRGDPDIRLKTPDPDAPLGIDLIRASHDQATRLRPGQTITLSCERVAETGDEHWLRNCAIQTVAGTPADRTQGATAPTASAAEGNTG